MGEDMAEELELIVDADRGVLLENFESTREARPLTIPNGDKKPISVRVARWDSQLSAYKEIDFTGKTARVGIGAVAGEPAAGTWTITHSGNTTSALNYNATAAEVETALEALASISGVAVTKFTDSNGYRIVWDAVGAQTDLTADTTGLFPTTSAFIEEAVAGDGSTKEVVVIAMETDPAAYVELSTALDTAAVTVTQIQTGVSSTTPEIQSYEFDPKPYDGSYTITIDGETTAALNWDATTSEIKAAIEALASIGAGNVTVTGGFADYTVTFDDSLGDVGAMTVSVSSLTVPTGRKGDIELRTANMLELLDGAASVSAKLEVVVHTTSTGRGWTACQVPVTVIKDLVADSPAAVTPSPGYLSSATGINYRPDIDNPTGGTSSDLDSIATEDITTPYMLRTSIGEYNEIRDYVLVDGTDAENSPKIIRPDDYAASTNEKVWKLVSYSIDSLDEAEGTLGVVGDANFQALVDMTGLPTSDPAIAGRLWNDSGTVKVSAG